VLVVVLKVLLLSSLWLLPRVLLSSCCLVLVVAVSSCRSWQGGSSS